MACQMGHLEMDKYLCEKGGDKLVLQVGNVSLIAEASFFSFVRFSLNKTTIFMQMRVASDVTNAVLAYAAWRFVCIYGSSGRTF